MKLDRQGTHIAYESEMARLMAIENSLAWRIAMKVMDIVDRLFPQHTVRGRFLTSAADLLRTRYIQQPQHISYDSEMARLKAIENSLCWRIIRKFLDIIDVLFPWHTRRGRFLQSMAKRIGAMFLSKQKVVSTISTSLPSPHLGKVVSEEINVDDQHKSLHDLEHIVFDSVIKPLVSLIIPVFDRYLYTYACLKSIRESTNNEIPFEVIVANDNSTDETQEMLSKIKGILVITNDDNLGFLRNCNNAARHALGKYILFLNNDVNVLKDWLSSLVNLIEKDKTIGMVGSKLVYPDGRLQEAGGIIWKDASGWNYGKNEDPEKPEYNYVKEVDYISGACIMIRKDLWNKIGGFDERFSPAYFEDSDFAFSVRKHGYKVMYQPKSVVVHFEGVSHGTDIYSGIKSYQTKNRAEFVEKWKDVLEREHFNNGEHVFYARDRSKDKKTILVIDHYVPQYDKDAGSRTIYQYLKLFTEIGLNVKFLGDNFAKHEPYTTELQQMGIEVLYGEWHRNRWKGWIQKNANYIDYIFLSRPHISIKYINYLKKNTKAKIIYYGHDLHYLRNLRRYEIEKNEECLRDSLHWEKIEAEIFRKADVVCYPSQIEVDEVNRKFPSTAVRVIPGYIYDNIPDKIFDNFFDNFKERKDLLFVGGFGHPPNVDGILWFAEKIFPLVLNVIPDMKVYVVGSKPPDEIIGLQSPNIKITGYVSDEQLKNYYKMCRLVVVPLRYGAGVKGKVVEAVYHQVPVVTTTVGAEGLYGAEDILIISDNEKAFAQEIINLYNDSDRWYQISHKSSQYVKDNFSKEISLKIITDFIKENKNIR